MNNSLYSARALCPNSERTIFTCHIFASRSSYVCCFFLFIARHGLHRLFLAVDAFRWSLKPTHQEQNVQERVHTKHAPRSRKSEWRLHWSPVWQCLPCRPYCSQGLGRRVCFCYFLIEHSFTWSKSWSF
jgi:hypothetical protein